MRANVAMKERISILNDSLFAMTKTIDGHSELYKEIYKTMSALGDLCVEVTTICNENNKLVGEIADVKSQLAKQNEKLVDRRESVTVVAPAVAPTVAPVVAPAVAPAVAPTPTVIVPSVIVPSVIVPPVVVPPVAMAPVDTSTERPITIDGWVNLYIKVSGSKEPTVVLKRKWIKDNKDMMKSIELSNHVFKPETVIYWPKDVFEQINMYRRYTAGSISSGSVIDTLESMMASTTDAVKRLGMKLCYEQ